MKIAEWITWIVIIAFLMALTNDKARRGLHDIGTMLERGISGPGDGRGSMPQILPGDLPSK